jgi:diacylglycerol kinase family enzyme
VAGIVIIHNPFARGNIRRPWIADKLRATMGDFGELIITRNIDQIPEVAANCMKNQIEYLGVNGGDGSLHLVLGAFVRVYKEHPLPTIIVLRGGTMNTLANSVKIKGKTVQILRTVIDKYKAKQPIETMNQHMVRLNEKYGFMSGAGVPPNFLAAYYGGTSTGPWQGFKVLAHTVGSIITQGPFMKFMAQPAHCKVNIDGEELSPRYFTAILGCSIREVGLGCTPTPLAYAKPGHFHFIAATIKPLEIVKKFPDLWLKREIEHHDLFSRVTKRARVEPLENMRYMIDGELYETEEPIDYECGPTIQLVKN